MVESVMIGCLIYEMIAAAKSVTYNITIGTCFSSGAFEVLERVGILPPQLFNIQLVDVLT